MGAAAPEDNRGKGRVGSENKGLDFSHVTMLSAKQKGGSPMEEQEAGAMLDMGGGQQPRRKREAKEEWGSDKKGG